MKKLVLALSVLFLFVTNASAVTYTIGDSWINWPGYDTGNAYQNITDHLGHPDVLNMQVTVSEAGMLEEVVLNFDQNWLPNGFDNLFINSYNETTTGNSWDSWDYVVHSGGSSEYYSNRMTGSPILVDGLYTVTDATQYTYVGDYNGRFFNPNGIDSNYASLLDASIAGSLDSVAGVQSYDFTTAMIDVSDGFYLAWSPWCANDVIGGSPVPEPATLLLLGSGILGLGFYRRFKK